MSASSGSQDGPLTTGENKGEMAELETQPTGIPAPLLDATAPSEIVPTASPGVQLPIEVPPAPPQLNVTVNTNVQTAAPTVVVVNNNSGPSLLVRAFYFVFVGWWLSFWWVLAAWFLILLVVTLPLGLLMINKLPAIATLKPRSQTTKVTTEGTVTKIENTTLPQVTFWIRAVYFLLIGWWFSLLWMETGWLFGITIIGLPVAMLMYDRTPAITTLARY